MNINLEYRPNSGQLTGKLIVLAVLMFVTWVATMFVWGVVQDREHRQEEAATEIERQWSRAQTIAGPVITVPVERTSMSSTGELLKTTTTLTLLPKDLSYESEIETELLKRSIYETPVYTTNVSGSGSFDLGELSVGDGTVLWDKAVISINVSDPRGIAESFDLTFDEHAHTMLPASEFTTLDSSGVHALVPIDPNTNEHLFSFTMPLKGSRELSFLPLGDTTDVYVHSSWAAPSFTGEFLPQDRSVSENGFEASWQIASYGKNLPQSWEGTTEVTSATLSGKTFGVALFNEVDFYTMVDRSVKYSILFIALTFLTFFMYEVLAGLRIHPMQYLLVGLAIALFYLLLLSFSEIIGFLTAYLAAATATTALITGYCFSVLKVKGRAFSIAALLSALYGYLYILLQMDQYSLLFGSVLLFGVLAVVMYLTRNINWYDPSEK